MTFADLGLSDELLRAVGDAGYSSPTPIQEKAIPYVLMGRDVLGCAQTGTGKTAGFVLPMLDILSSGRAKARMPRSLILEPTRELAAQVAENFDTYGKYQRLSKALLIGGESMNDQIKVIESGVDVLIATPGRLLDLFERGKLLLTDVRILVIDEADRMMDMGFMPDVEKIVGFLPTMRTTLLFSATMPPEIRKLSDKFLMNPKELSVAPPSSTASTIEQGVLILKPRATPKDKRDALRQMIRNGELNNAIVFCNRKRDVSTVYRSLQRHGFNAGELHGDMAQPARMATLEKFKGGDIKILVCSDVAARGLDIPSVTHVFNFDVPTHAEDYVHRIGRTGRAGRSGHAYSIALAEDAKYVAGIEKLIGKPIPQLDGSTKKDAKSNEKNPDEKKAESKLRKARQTDGGKAEGGSHESPEPEIKEPKPVFKAANDEADSDDEKQSKRSRRGNRNGDGAGVFDHGDSTVGLGEHVPAFMMQKTGLEGKQGIAVPGVKKPAEKAEKQKRAPRRKKVATTG